MSARSPPAKSQNSTTQNATTLPSLGKRPKRCTVDSNSSSNSSKTPTGRSRTNSQEDQNPTGGPPQEKPDDYASNGRTRPARKKSGSGRVSGHTSAAASAPRTGPTSSQMRQSPSHIPVPVPSNWPAALLGGRSNPVGRTLTRLRPASPQHGGSASGSTHNPDYQVDWEGMAAHANDSGMRRDEGQHGVPPNEDGNGWTDYLHSTGVDHESLMSQTLPVTGNFYVDSDAGYPDGEYNGATSHYTG